MKSSEVCIKTRSPPASLPIQGQATKHTTVKWPIVLEEGPLTEKALPWIDGKESHPQSRALSSEAAQLLTIEDWGVGI